MKLLPKELKLNSIIAAILPYAAAAVAAIGALVWARQSGRKSAQNEQAADERKAIDKAKGVENEISSMDDDDINRRLTSWVRGNKR